MIHKKKLIILKLIIKTCESSSSSSGGSSSSSGGSSSPESLPLLLSLLLSSLPFSSTPTLIRIIIATHTNDTIMINISKNTNNNEDLLAQELLGVLAVL